MRWRDRHGVVRARHCSVRGRRMRVATGVLQPMQKPVSETRAPLERASETVGLVTGKPLMGIGLICLAMVCFAGNDTAG